MFSHTHYVPILKFRQGEYLAMGRSSPSIQDWMTPLFELPTEPWDFEEEAPSKSLDEHLSQFGKRLSRNWKARCFVDSPYIDGAATVASGTHHLEHIFSLARSEDCVAVPVVGIERDIAYKNAVAAIVAMDRRGACIRLSPDDFTPGISIKISTLLNAIGVTFSECDLIIDANDDISGSPNSQAVVWSAQIASLPQLSDWRSLTVAGGSFPASLAPASLYRPYKDIERKEWLAYKELLKIRLDRVPTFGDYSATSPKTFEMDPRLMDPNAKVKYTHGDHWRVVVGNQVKRNGRSQYETLCQTLINSLGSGWPGPTYSHGDEFIHDCAAGKGNGGSSTWPTVTTSHHAAAAVRNIAILFGFSPVP
ncbi:beta family protein [Xanthomonas cannabis]|uniref:beta family protein n=1 Tax=Xanthomonas cannabis TaxID=1885674 RepID=UPI001E3E2243|nr:beta family protein [Xanthomonas cannabis]MCC8444768.1 beta family protein [Xanthomonas cannabis]